jgi:Rrf2 family protein
MIHERVCAASIGTVPVPCGGLRRRGVIRVSTRGRYALRAVVDVCMNSDRGPTSRQDIAERQGISSAYVAQLFRKLTRAGILRSVRGPGGGYTIARDPASITAGDILRAVEGPIAVVHCVEGDGASSCERAGACATHRVWGRLSDVMAEYLDSITLQSLCEESVSLERAAGRRAVAAIGPDPA